MEQVTISVSSEPPIAIQEIFAVGKFAPVISDLTGVDCAWVILKSLPDWVPKKTVLCPDGEKGEYFTHEK